jgi:hypothetical protein
MDHAWELVHVGREGVASPLSAFPSP